MFLLSQHPHSFFSIVLILLLLPQNLFFKAIFGVLVPCKIHLLSRGNVLVSHVHQELEVTEYLVFLPPVMGSMDCSWQVSCVHEILQARIQEWVAIPFSRGSSQPKD